MIAHLAVLMMAILFISGVTWTHLVLVLVILQEIAIHCQLSGIQIQISVIITLVYTSKLSYFHYFLGIFTEVS